LFAAWRADALFIFTPPDGTKSPVQLSGPTGDNDAQDALRVDTGKPLLDATGKPLRLIGSDLVAVEHHATLRRAMKAVLDLGEVAHPDPEKRRQAIHALGFAQAADKIPALEARLKIETDPIRAAKLAKNAFSEVEPDDLLRFGLIPELVGRLPVTVPLEGLDEESLVRILQEPKNALTKQYTKLFDLEEVKLTFEPSALRAIAGKALKRGTGARGLRAILEELLTDVMFDLPTREDVVEVKITESSVVNGTTPLLELAPTKRKKEA
jgi:ATP-dependent protease Clp ATPase subunit